MHLAQWRRMRSITRLGLAMLALTSVSTSFTRTADACGGTFCDRGPNAMPVDQKGENILYVMEPGQIEAHIQIQYKGEAARFAWVLPMPALPDVQIGSLSLFTGLLGATVPTYGYTTQPDICGDQSTGGSSGTGGSTSIGYPGDVADA